MAVRALSYARLTARVNLTHAQALISSNCRKSQHRDNSDATERMLPNYLEESGQYFILLHDDLLHNERVEKRWTEKSLSLLSRDGFIKCKQGQSLWDRPDWMSFHCRLPQLSRSSLARQSCFWGESWQALAFLLPLSPSSPFSTSWWDSHAASSSLFETCKTKNCELMSSSIVVTVLSCDWLDISEPCKGGRTFPI